MKNTRVKLFENLKMNADTETCCCNNNECGYRDMLLQLCIPVYTVSNKRPPKVARSDHAQSAWSRVPTRPRGGAYSTQGIQGVHHYSRNHSNPINYSHRHQKSNCRHRHSTRLGYCPHDGCQP